MRLSTCGIRMNLVLMAALMVLSFGQIARANPVFPACQTGTATSYSGLQCSIGDYSFSFPSLAAGSGFYVYTPGDVAVRYREVTVTPVGDGSAGSPTGFIFSAANWTASDSLSGFADVNITFNVNLDLDPQKFVIDTGAMSLSSTLTNPAGTTYVGGGETFTNNLTSGNIGKLNLTDSDPGTNVTSGQVHLGATNINVNKDIVIVGADEGSIAKLNSLEETFTYTAIPEPGSFLLAGAGIGLLFLLRRRKSIVTLVGVVALMAAISPAVHASPVTCLSISQSYANQPTLQNFMSAGSCAIGDVTFGFGPSSFTESGTAFRIPNPSNITVNIQGLGFQFVLLGIVNAGQNETFSITYTATAASNRIKGFSSSATVSDNGIYSFSGSSAQLKNGATTISSVPFPIGGVGNAFTPVLPKTTLTIVDTMHLSATGAGSYAHVSNLTNDLTVATPEPLTSMLCGAGLLLFGLAFRSRKSKD
jgi:hypothetical protein